jgi:hypothetical protein
VLFPSTMGKGLVIADSPRASVAFLGKSVYLDQHILYRRETSHVLAVISSVGPSSTMSGSLIQHGQQRRLVSSRTRRTHSRRPYTSVKKSDTNTTFNLKR